MERAQLQTEVIWGKFFYQGSDRERGKTAKKLRAEAERRTIVGCGAWPTKDFKGKIVELYCADRNPKASFQFETAERRRASLYTD